MKPSEPKYTTIRFHIGHNHDFGVQNKPKSPSVEVKNIFIKMFDNGFSPKQAIQSFRDHIRKQITSDSEFNKFINDKEKFPKYCWVWNLHKSYFLKKNSQEVDIVKGLKELVENRNAEFNECVCSYRRFDEENYCVAIMTPFMKRISQASEASQLVFMDSAGSIEKYGLKVYSLMCKTKAGVAPLGLVITNNDTDLSIEKSLRLLLQLGDGRSFGGRSTRSPIFFMTKDSSAEISALRSVFPKCIHLLSTYHVLQTLYRWLFNSVHQISEETRYRIYVLIRKMIYAENEEDIETYYHQVEKDFGENSQAFEYFQSWYERKEKWMLYYRILPQVKGSSFTDSIEKYICVLKNHVLNRIKLQSLTLLVDYMIKEYSQSYVEKFLNHIKNDSCDEPEESILTQMNNYQFFRSSECSTIYVVSNQSKGVMYETNYEIGTCTCFVGVNGSSACKHQQMLLYYLRQMNKTSSNLQNEDDKSEVYFLATGNSAIPNEFFQPVNEVVEELVNIEDHITEEVIDLDDYIIYKEIPNVNLSDNQDEMRTEFNNFKKTVNEMLTMLEANPNYYKEGIKSFQGTLHQALETPYRLREFLLTQPKD